ncbi:hypothetical protein QTP70_029205, partial [Hemibagrus guttatus]
MDQEKAFDQVEHQYLWRALETFEFNSVYRAMIQGWRSALTSEECMQLRDYCAGVVSPVEGEPSPVLAIVLNLSEVSGPLLGDGERTAMGLNTAS